MTLFEYDKQYIDKEIRYICGVDEAGRGPIAGPVVASAVILDMNYIIEGINDSKKLSEKERDILFDKITLSAISYGIGIVDNITIDKINILNATKKAMLQAINSLKFRPDIILTDFVKLDKSELIFDLSNHNVKEFIIPIVKGDAKSANIASASIIAKVTRDNIMKDIGKEYPNYMFAKHKGYPTKEHIDLVKRFGITDYHRKTFKPISLYIEQYELFKQ